MALPSVFAYLDYRTFLEDWLDERRRQDPDYSYATFAQASGCSKATLANVIGGARTPRTDTLDAFAHAMGLSPGERNFLGLLVEFSSAPDLSARRAVMDRILSAERYGQLRLAESDSDDDVFRYLEHWYVPAIRELAALPGFQPDAAWIATHLRPRITVDEAEDALQTLLELDFLRARPDGTLEPAEIRFRTQSEARPKAAFHFHREVVPELLRHIDTDLSDAQHLLACTVVLSPRDLPEAKARLNSLIEQLATLGDDRAPDGPHRVYQVAVQLLPISEAIG